MSLRKERNGVRTKIHSATRSSNTSLTVIMGDFNTATRASDRWDITNGVPTGERDKGEEEHWQETVAQRHGLYELGQDQFTFNCSLSRSRIDRIYTNQPPSNQIDHSFSCSALEWVNNLSNHRAVAFSRTTKPPPITPLHPRPLQPWVLQHTRFPSLVASIFLDRCHKTSLGSNSAIGELKFLKEAIVEAAEEINLTKPLKPELLEDKVGAYLGLLKAVEARQVNSMKKWLRFLPETDWIDQHNSSTWGEESRHQLREFAHKSAKAKSTKQNTNNGQRFGRMRR